jgi:hypothetical protein
MKKPVQGIPSTYSMKTVLNVPINLSMEKRVLSIPSTYQ